MLLGDVFGADIRRIVRQHRLYLPLFLQEFRSLANRFGRAVIALRGDLLRGADHFRIVIETTPIDFMAYGFSNRRRLEGL